ncbi:hypothetical protein ACFUIW_10995 [Streptomyces sp. NPDC057245]|uniref:hypothetical protein n=1 Tax=Streptomyces sp. NPDC057245 TaxID=3346065 RepID=UPI0036357A31
MFASLLPGFRHFRTPFTVGAIVAFEVWVTAGGLIPGPNEARGYLQRLYALGDLAGKPLVLSAAAFVFYILGDVLRVAPWKLVRKIGRVVPMASSDLSEQSTFQLRRLIGTAYQERGIPGDREMYSLIRQILSEFNEIRFYLTVNHADVYSEHDRLIAEAEFRINVTVHSAILWGLMAIVWSPWFSLGFLVSLRLYGNGLRALRDANAIIVQSVVSGVTTSQVYEREKRLDREFNSVAGAP